ncbi:MAG TPA: HD domain-containing phosphohydrolase [Candidatus Baltobacteraceae bacterium]|nr:HD domain-containing phosphohydrolase [Candidatus Baltobacteraceae bacterium]
MNHKLAARRQADRDCSIIDALRPELATEVLYRSCTARERTVVADAFIDATIDRVIEARSGGDTAPLSAWLSAALGDAGLSPGFAILADTCVVLEASLERAGIRDAVLREELRSAAARAMESLRHEERASPTRAIDEVDARINDLFARLETADVLTAEHSRAVSSWCGRLGRRLGLCEQDVTLLTRCGLLHDIGKLKVPAEILNAPRALSPTEWRVIRAHAAAGESIAKKEPLLRQTLPGIRSHHERFTGGGYPDGLRGDAIPFVARVVSVADCFNAMIGRRPYRPPLSPTFALEELQRNRGTQFDPELVDAMIDVVLHTP